MWTRKAATAAALLLCAHTTLADGVRVWIGGGGASIGVGWSDRDRDRGKGHRREAPRGHKRDRGRDQDHHRAPERCIEEHVVNLCLDGHEVRARISVWRDECGQLASRVHLASLEPCGLPTLERVSVHLEADGKEWCPTLCKQGHCDSRQATYGATGGPKVCENSRASVIVNVEGCGDSKVIKLRSVTL